MHGFSFNYLNLDLDLDLDLIILALQKCSTHVYSTNLLHFRG